MSAYYITGVSGTGKSTVVENLKDYGIAAFDIDDIYKLCDWKHKETGKIAEYTKGIGKDWVDAHDYVCDIEKLGGILKKYKNSDVVIAGMASNQNEYISLFDKVILFYCPEDVFLKRLSTRTNNPFGKEPAEQEHILEWYRDFQQEMISKGAISINTDRPIHQVVRAVIDLIKSE